MALIKVNLIHTHRHPRRRLRLLFGRIYLQRSLRILPNLFTLGNAFFGFCAIIFAAHGNMIAAAYLILWGALFDALDGRVARYAQVSSELGMQLDSLCDGISFCMAPAVLMYLWQLHKAGIVGLLICAVFLLAGLLRLAKFNLTHRQQQIAFLGVPTTVAGCFLATIVLMNKNLLFTSPHLIVLGLVVLTLAMLMVSPIPFPAFKKLSKGVTALFFSCMSVFVITFGLTKLLFSIFIIYFVYAFEEFFRIKFFNNKKS